MTPALKAMVEAMVAELNAQAQSGWNSPYVDDGISEIDPEPSFNSILIDGRVDLEKVARAGLAAIREPSDAMTYSGSWAVGPGGDREKKAELAKAFSAMIDALLKEPA